MFLQVYFHKTRGILDVHLVDCLKELNGGTEWRYPIEIGQYMKWDDNRVLCSLEENMQLESARRLLQRKHFRLLHETKPHANLDEQTVCRMLHRGLTKEFSQEALRLVSAETSVSKRYSYVDRSSIRIRMIVGEHSDDFVPLVSREEEIEGASQALEHLRPITMLRIYCDRDKFEQIRGVYRELLAGTDDGKEEKEPNERV